jgi:hypothetical protein
MEDHEVVEAFIAYLGDNGYPGLRIDRRPEEENRKSKDIEAIAGQFAIEHTFIPRFSDQKAQEDRFIKAIAGLESELPIPPYELYICSEYYAVKIGQDWSAIRSSVKAWIIREAHHLADGEKIIDDIGIPFRLRVEKLNNGRPGIYFGRHLPDNNDSLPLRIHEHLTSKKKIEKLVPYKKDGFTTVLLIEANLTRNKMLHAVKLAFPDGLHPDLDEIWYISTWGNHIGKFTKLPKWGGNKK